MLNCLDGDRCQCSQHILLQSIESIITVFPKIFLDCSPEVFNKIELAMILRQQQAKVSSCFNSFLNKRTLLGSLAGSRGCAWHSNPSLQLGNLQSHTSSSSPFGTSHTPPAQLASPLAHLGVQDYYLETPFAVLLNVHPCQTIHLASLLVSHWG